MAEELVELYRRRLAVEGHAFGPDTPWQAEMEGAFGFVETDDQLQAIDDVKADMEQPRPMDRLVCGDVGFGKTEVAVRAVFKAVQDGKQAAVLAPDHPAGQPARPDLRRPLRALPGAGRAAEPLPVAGPGSRRSSRGWPTAAVDVVIGTHRLLGEDVAFKHLGLLVVDEEQRFGVTHKEAVKRLAEGVDVLTLTASPIPRTLEMALTGIRDLSMVNTPPADRRPILTYVGEQDPAAVSEALRRELLREGQVFYVHNRVSDIEKVARRRAGPGARGPGGHRPRADGRGQPGDRWCSTSGSASTTCWCAPPSSSRASTCRRSTPWWSTGPISSGLGQLHQIRGRVGPRRPAGLRLPLPSGRPGAVRAVLRAAAHHRRAHRAGSGFKIAMRDLEIRGAGNLLGLRPVRPHRRRGLRPVRAAGGRGGGRGQGRGAADPADGGRSTCPAMPICPRTT